MFEWRIADLTGQPSAGPPGGKQIPALGRRHDSGVLVGLRQGHVKRRGIECNDVLLGIKDRLTARHSTGWRHGQRWKTHP
jgi:hypothetical protein